MTRIFPRTTVLLLLAAGCAPLPVAPSSVAPPSVNVEPPRASASSEVEPPDPEIVSVTPGGSWLQCGLRPIAGEEDEDVISPEPTTEVKP